MSIAGQLHQAMLDAGLAISGVVVDKENDPSTWRVQFFAPPSKTDQNTVASVIANFRAAVEVPAPSLDKVVAALLAKGVLSQNDVQ